jgi:hypothetical protein
MRSLLILGAFLAACGGDDSPNPDAPTAPDAPPAADAPQAADAPETPDAPEPPDATPLPDATEPPDAPPAADAGPVTAEGLVIVTEQLTAGSPEATASASFSSGPLFGGPTMSAGECGFYPAASETGLSAGTIDVTGTSTPVTLTPSGPGSMVMYSATPDPLPVDLFTAGATISVSAAGADVPAFSGSVTAPSPIGGYTPPITISRSTPPALTWTAGTGTEMWVWGITFDTGSSDANVIWCRTADDGSYTIPGAAWAFMPPTDVAGVIILWRVNTSVVSAGGTAVSISGADAVVSDPSLIGP